MNYKSSSGFKYRKEVQESYKMESLNKMDPDLDKMQRYNTQLKDELSEIF